MVSRTRHAHTWQRSALAVAVGMLTMGVSLHAVAQPAQPRAKPGTNSQPLNGSSTNIGQCLAKEINQVYIPIRGGSFPIITAPGHATHIRFPEWVELRDAIYPFSGFRFEENKDEHSVTVTPPKNMPKGTTANLVLNLPPLVTTIDVRLAEENEEHNRLVLVKPVPQEEYERRMAITREEERRKRESAAGIGPALCKGMSVDEQRAVLARFLLDLEEFQSAGGAVALASDAGVVESGLVGPGEIRAAIRWAVKMRGERFGLVTIANRTGESVEVTGGAVAKVGAHKSVSGKIFWEESARTVGGTLVLEDKTSARGVVVLPAGVGDSIDDVAVHFIGSGGLTVAIGEIIELYPLPEDEKRRRRMATQTTVSVRGVFGGFWTGPGDDLGGTDGTMMAGIGVRVGKGMHKNFAFEGEIVGGRSGQARFTDVPWSGAMGDVVRQASFGRIQGNGVIRFGTEVVASMRLGVGIQLASYDSTFTTGGNLMDGPGDGIEVDGLWATGASLDARLGEHWNVGITLGFVDGFNTDGRSLEGAIQIGYGINATRPPY